MSRFRPAESVRPTASSVVTAPPARIFVPANTKGLQSPLQMPVLPGKQVRDGFDDPIRKIGLWFAYAFIFNQISFLHEILGVTLHLQSYLPTIFGVPAMFCVFLGGGLPRLFSRRTFWFFLCMLAWMMLALPFGIWPSDSFRLWRGLVEFQCISLLMLGGLVLTIDELRRMFYVVAAAGVVNIFTGTFLTKGEGRLELQISMIGNSNDFAAQLLLLLSIMWAVSATPQVPRLIRFGLLLSIPYALLLCLSTGSRGALLSMIVGFVYIVIRASGWRRIATLVSVPLMLLVLIAKSGSGDRLSTLINDKLDPEDEAQASLRGRKHQMMKGVEFTAQHPLFGVGMGQFALAEGYEARKEGQRGYWHETHNAYVQISSENGLPPLLFLLSALVLSYRQVSRVLREARLRKHLQLERYAFAVLIAIAVFCTATFFLSLGYRFYFPLLIGLSLALLSVAEREFGPNFGKANPTRARAT